MDRIICHAYVDQVSRLLDLFRRDLCKLGLYNKFYQRALAPPFGPKEWARLEIQKTFGLSRHTLFRAAWSSQAGHARQVAELFYILHSRKVFHLQTQRNNAYPLHGAVQIGLRKWQNVKPAQPPQLLR